MPTSAAEHHAPVTDLPTPNALLQIANTSFAEGLVQAAGHLFGLAAAAGADAATARTAQRRAIDAQVTDAAIAQHGFTSAEFFLPSAERRDDGTPLFLLPLPVEAAGQAEVLQVIASELTGDGVDAELRNFLAVMIEPGDAYIDCDPGFGFASLAAASRHPGQVSVVTRGADEDHAAFIRHALTSNRVRSASVEAPVNGTIKSLGDLFRHATVERAARVVIYAGQAEDIDAMLPDISALLNDRRVEAIAWSVGAASASDAVADRLQTLGASHFVIASDSEGAVLVPRSELNGATLIISLPAHVLADRQAA